MRFKIKIIEISDDLKSKSCPSLVLNIAMAYSYGKICLFFVRMRRFLLTFDMNDISYLVN